MSASSRCKSFGNWQSFLDAAVCRLRKNNSLGNFPVERSGVNILKWIFVHDLAREVEWIDDYFTPASEHASQGKCDVEAQRCREQGNNKFKVKKYEEALQFYTKSIFLSSPAGEPIALGYANRSAALHYLKLYQECIGDISHAFSHGYPENLQYKLYIRRAQAHLALKQTEGVSEDLSQAKYLILTTVQNETRQGVLMGDVTSLREKLEELEEQGCSDTQPLPESSVVPRVSHGENTVVVQATSAVELLQDEERGRFLQARQDLKAGDTLIVERPFAAVLLPSHYHSHCHHCFVQLGPAPLPCHQCVEVQFCSGDCRDAAWHQYHWLECHYLDLCHSIGIAHLSMRVVLTAGLKFLMDFQKDMEGEVLPTESNQIPGVTSSGQYERNYLTVFALMPHIDDMHSEDLVQYGLTAALLLRCLKEGGFFSTQQCPQCINGHQKYSRTSNNHLVHNSEIADKDTDSSECACDKHNIQEDISPETHLYIGSLLLRHICQLVCNAHAITELQITQAVDSSLVEGKSQVRVATAIYPTASLMNHSCDPTILSSFHKDTLVVRAVKDVKAGEEIFNCYGPHCKRMSFSERQQCLSEQYFFTCQCTACMSGVDKEHLLKACRCPHCTGPLSAPHPQMTCQDCGRSSDGVVQMRAILQAHELFQKGLQLMTQTQNKEALGILEQCHQLRAAVQYRYHRELAEVRDALAQCHASLGDFSKALSYLSLTIPSTEFTYGPTSIELANELQKLAEVQFHAGKKKEAVKTAEKAEKLFELNYGDTHQSVKEMRELKMFMS